MLKNLYENVYTLFCISNSFISNARLKLAKNQANAKQHHEAELLQFENYSHSSSTLLSKNNMAYSKNNQKNKCVSFHNIMWLIIMRMKMKKKILSHRYGMDKPRSKQGHKYCKFKKCLNMMWLICIEQHLSNIWSNISLITSYSFIPCWIAW